MSHWLRLLRLSVLTLLVTAGLGCRGADTDEVLGAADRAAAAETGEAVPPPAAGSPSRPFDNTGEFGIFPTFMPPVAFGTETQNCQLGTDPYSTCI